jgi:nucleoid-associated protein YgaU
MADTLKIGTVSFQIDDLPEGIGLGGDAMISVLKFPGGYREVQAFGTQDRDIQFQGQLNYSAVNSMKALDKLYASGGVQNVIIGPFKLTAVIAQFYWTYISAANIQYDLTLTPAQARSLVVPSSSSSSISSLSNSSPKNVSPKPQKTYVVKKGDSLWKVAVLEYKDGTQWKKIYTANHLKTTVIEPGQKLVIP